MQFNKCSFNPKNQPIVVLPLCAKTLLRFILLLSQIGRRVESIMYVPVFSPQMQCSIRLREIKSFGIYCTKRSQLGNFLKSFNWEKIFIEVLEIFTRTKVKNHYNRQHFCQNQYICAMPLFVGVYQATFFTFFIHDTKIIYATENSYDIIIVHRVVSFFVLSTSA